MYVCVYIYIVCDTMAKNADQNLGTIKACFFFDINFEYRTNFRAIWFAD